MTNAATITIGSLTLTQGAKYEDGSTIADVQGIDAIFAEALTYAKTTGTAAEKLNSSSQDLCASLGAMLSRTRDSKGNVNWNRGKAPDSYKALQSALIDAAIPPVGENEAQSKQDARTDRVKRLTDAIGTAWTVRGGVDLAIYTYCRSTVQPSLTETEGAKLEWVRGKTGGVKLPEIGSMPDRLADLIRTQYANSDGLKMPVVYGGTKGKGSGGGSQGSGQSQTPAEAESVLRQSVQSAKKVSIDQAAEWHTDLTRSIALVVARFTDAKKGHEFPQQTVLEHLDASDAILDGTREYLSLVIAGKADADARDQFLAMLVPTLTTSEMLLLGGPVLPVPDSEAAEVAA